MKVETKTRKKFCNLYEVDTSTGSSLAEKTQLSCNLAQCSTTDSVIDFQLDTFSCIPCLGLLERK